MRLVALCTPELCIAAPLEAAASSAPFLMYDAIIGESPAEILATLAERGIAVDRDRCAEVLRRAARGEHAAAMSPSADPTKAPGR